MTVEITEDERLLILAALSEYRRNCTECSRKFWSVVGLEDFYKAYKTLAMSSHEVMEKFRPT